MTSETAQHGTVTGIFLGPAGMVERALAEAGLGLAGDRYHRAAGSGFFFEQEKKGQDITLVEAEALEGLAADTGIELTPEEARRNIVTRGIRLNDLVGKQFRVGDALCFGARLCPPCAHLEQVTRPGVLRGLVDRGGLRADVIAGGEIAVGDAVVVL